MVEDTRLEALESRLAHLEQGQQELSDALYRQQRELDALGVAGYTVSDARGRGDKGLRASHWGHSSNIRVEIVCDTSLAERVLARLREKYYAHYAIVMWVVDVEVLRPDKFR